MQLNQLTLTYVRALDKAEFVFHPGMNLIVGINGAGKSTVLDAIRLMLSQTISKFTGAKIQPVPFLSDDITTGKEALTAELKFSACDIEFNYLVQQPRYDFGYDDEASDRDELEKGREDSDSLNRRKRIQERRLQLEGFSSRKVQRLTSNPNVLSKKLKTSKSQPVAVYFSPHRSLVSMKAPKKPSPYSAAFVEALAERALLLRQHAEWWLLQNAPFTRRLDNSPSIIDILTSTIECFLEDYTNIRAVREPEPTLILEKLIVRESDIFFEHANKRELKDSHLSFWRKLVCIDALAAAIFEFELPQIDARQLSDGERGTLALVLDLAKRLIQANPKLENPVRDGKAVVLIDEIGLHLHPRWQRSIVQKLTNTFPNCQFIATTHSPQIIGEVVPESILILEKGEQPYRPNQALGMDTNWILRNIMGAQTRDAETRSELEKIKKLIRDEAYDDATDAIDELAEERGNFPELVGYQSRIDRIRILGE